MNKKIKNNKMKNPMLRISNIVSNSIGNYINNAFNQLTELNLINKKDINLFVSRKYKVYISENYSDLRGYTRNPEGERTNNLPLNSESLTELNKFISEENIDSIRGGLILMNTMPEYSSGEYNLILPKCLSNEIITLFSDLACSAISWSSARNAGLIKSNPCSNNSLFNLYGIFESERSLGLESNIVFPFHYIRSIANSPKNSFSCEFREVIFKNFFNRNTCCKQVKDLPDHNPGIFKSKLAMTDFIICNNILVNLNSHCMGQKDNELFKSFDLQIAFTFEIQNDGNCLLNISLNATDLWASIFGNSSYFQFKIDNKTGEEGSFNWTTSQTSWHYVPNSTEAAIFGFNWSDATDSAEIDLLVTVPPQEPAGDKSSTLYFISTLGE